MRKTDVPWAAIFLVHIRYRTAAFHTEHRSAKYKRRPLRTVFLENTHNGAKDKRGTAFSLGLQGRGTKRYISLFNALPLI